MQKRLLTMCIALALLLTGAVQAKVGGNYAEGIYAEYTAGSGDRILFELETLNSGRLTDLAGKTFGEVLAQPEHRVVSTQFGTQINNPRFATSFAKALGHHDLDLSVDGFEEHGYPVVMGRYRHLLVAAAIDSDIREHEALEICFPRLGHCTLLDPTVVFLQSVVNTRLRLRAEGWGPRVTYSGGDEGAFTTKASCGLSSNPSQTNRVNNWGSSYVYYSNVFGIKLVEKWLGSQQSGIRCSTSCTPAPYGYSNLSSCSGTAGYTCDCDNKFGVGTTGTTGKWIAETKCTHRFTLSAKASASVTNYGSASVDINWDLSGGVDSNGGQIIDTCGYF